MYCLKGKKFGPYESNGTVKQPFRTKGNRYQTSATVINEYTSQQGKSRTELREVSLHTYIREPVQVVGSVLVPVKFKSQKEKLPDLSRYKRQNLLDRDWLQELKTELGGNFQIRP